MALVAAAAADTSVNAEFGTTKINGATTTQGNVTQGNWEISVEKDGKKGSESVSYIVTGDKDDKKNRQMIKETIKKFDQFFYYAMDAKNLKLGSDEKQCEMFRCMNRAVVFANMDMKMNDHTISMRCQKATGAAYIAATFAASAATLAAYTLY